jgi:transposase
MEISLDALPEDPAALQAIILAQHQKIVGMAASSRAYEALIQALKLTIARLKRQKYGSSSEKIDREIAQLELALEGLEMVGAAADPAPASDASADDAATDTAATEQRLPPRRRGKPRIAADAPRESIILDPGEHCPDCGGALRLVGEDVAEILDFIAAKLKVIEIHRPKKSCRDCERMVQTPAPSRPIPRGLAGPSLLAHILVTKFDDHVPLYRQGEIFARMGADIPRSTLIDWCGQAAAAIRPVANLIRAELMATDRLHADDTPIRVLDPKMKLAGKERGVKEGRVWVYVRDDRPWTGQDPPAAAYWFSPDRKGEHPQTHLRNFIGILQADAYAGFRKLYERGIDGEPRIREAACWAHLRRDFHDIWKSTDSAIARDALEQIGKLYDVERAINGQPLERRLAARQQQSRPRVLAFRTWCEQQLGRIPGKGDLAKAMRYALGRWDSFTLFLDDARVAIDNNAAERAIRPVSIGRKNFLFAGADAGGEILADAMTVIETAKLSDLNPEAYLADILARIGDHDPAKLDDLLPWNWSARQPATAKAA